MKGIMKIILRYVLSAAGIAVILLITNFVILASWTALSSQYSNSKYTISEVSEGLELVNDKFILSDEAFSIIESNFEWAMLLDDNGKVIWSKNLPEDIPLSYTASDIASFSRWYLNDYPVQSWKHTNGLFILADSKNSTWKFQIQFPEVVMYNITKWLLAALIMNFTVAILLAFLFGIRFFRSLSKIIDGMKDLAEKKPVYIKTKGTFRDLAININNTSKELLRQEKLIKKRDTARNNWITSVSHDIRTPLSMIMGYSSSLEDNDNFSEEEKKQLSIIRLQSEKIKQLVNDLNLTVKLEYEMQPLNIQPFYISELIRKVVAYYLNNLYNDRYIIKLTISDEVQGHIVNGDIRLFERALNNIIGNSMKHNKEGCDIFIEVKKIDNECIIEIKDNGTGFEKEILEKLNLSYEMPSDVSHGLGLLIVKQIITVHGGKVCFTNWDNGSRIILTIPYSK
jgi:signal transduction histidine kinase